MAARALLIAATVLHRDRIAQTPYEEHPFPSDVETVMSADELAELAGRSCYQSWDRPNPATATNRGYLRNIIAREHFSVMEHASATFFVTGISRSLTHELIRHRHLSYSQLSQRYVDSSDADLVIPPAYRDDPDSREAVGELFEDAIDAYEFLAERGEANGLSRKEAREAARAVLPNCTETAIIVTGNMRAWRDVISKRNSEGADAEIRGLSQILLRQLKEVAPNCFQDMPIRGPLALVEDDGPIGTAVLTDDEAWRLANPALGVSVAENARRIQVAA